MRKDCKAVIFDMDGVIFDSEQLVLDCWDVLAQRHQLADIHEVMMECIGTNKVKTREIVMNHYGENFPYDEYSKESSQIFRNKMKEEGLPLKRGVREILTYLRDNKIPIGLASSTRIAVVTEELKMAELYDFFDVVVGGDQLKRSKPEPDIYLMACEQMGINPGDAYAIEDSYNGIRSAYRAGMKPIMIPDLLPATEEMCEISTVVLDDLLQAISYFEE